jgi:hypothetical protein
MTRPSLLALVAAVAVVAAFAAIGPGRARYSPRRVAAPPASSAHPDGTTGPSLVVAPAGRPASQDADATARRFVAAMWTRASGAPPLDWLDRVADVTDPALAAELRASPPTLADTATLSSSVEIDGAYPDAGDPLRVTVTCVAHLATRSGPRDVACADTVTLRRGSDGHLRVTGVA